jgi:hypothetical protein
LTNIRDREREREKGIYFISTTAIYRLKETYDLVADKYCVML